MKSMIVVLATLCLSCAIRAQTPPKIKPLQIGDTVPDLLFTHVADHPDSSFKLSDFKGKVVLLDFWATWCSPCVRSLPVLDSFQKKFEKDLVLIPISDEKETTVSHFFKMRKQLSPFSLVDTGHFFAQYFPYSTIPHAVLIDRNGVVASITKSNAIHEQDIQDIFDGRTTKLELKKDIVDYNPFRPLFTHGNGRIREDQVLFRSMVTRFQPGLPSIFTETSDEQGKLIGLTYVNHFVTHLFLQAAEMPDYLMGSRVFYAKGGELFPYYDSVIQFKDRTNAWLTRHVFSYDIIAPALSFKERNVQMLKDLTEAMAGMGVTIKFEERTINCLMMVATDRKLVRSAGGTPSRLHGGDDDKITIQNASLADLCQTVEGSCHMPVFTDSGDLRIDLSYQNANVKKYVPNEAELNLAFFKDLLKPHGLTLTPITRKVKVLVLYNPL